MNACHYREAKMQRFLFFFALNSRKNDSNYTSFILFSNGKKYIFTVILVLLLFDIFVKFINFRSYQDL